MSMAEPTHDTNSTILSAAVEYARKGKRKLDDEQ